MKRLLLALLFTGAAGISPVATASLVSAGTMILIPGTPYGSMGAHLVGDGFAIGTGGFRDGGAGIGDGPRFFTPGESANASFHFAGFSVQGVDFIHSGARGNILEATTTQFVFSEGQYTYSGTFQFIGTLCLPRFINGSSDNCDVLDFPYLEGHGNFETIFEYFPPGTYSLRDGVFRLVQTTYTFVPEPATLGLLGVGLAGVGFARRRKAVSF